MSDRVISRGSRGVAVRKLQTLLTAKGYNLSVDGIFGKGTRSAVLQYQAGEGLEADGVVGALTWGALTANADDSPQVRPEAIATPLVGGEAESVLAAALRDLGAKEEPNGSNRGGEIDHLVEGYGPYWRIAGADSFPWCAIAVSSWIGIGLGLGCSGSSMNWTAHPFGRWLGGVAQIEDWAKSVGCWRPSRDAQAGDVFLMLREGSGSDPSRASRAGHTGLILSVDGDTVETIEGNASNSVALRTRKVTTFTGVARWWEGR